MITTGTLIFIGIVLVFAAGFVAAVLLFGDEIYGKDK